MEPLFEYLDSCLKANLLVWFHDGEGYQLMNRIIPEYPAEEESGPCLFFKHLPGSYVALDCVDLNDLVITSPNIAKFPVEN